MTSRSRLLAALSGKLPDRVPVAPFVYTGWLESSPPASVDALLRETDPIVGMSLAPDLHWLLGREAANRWRREYQGDLVIDHLDTPRGTLRRVSRLAERRREDRERDLSGPVDYGTDALLKRAVQTIEWFCKSVADLEAFLSIPYEPPQLDLDAYHSWDDRLGESALLMPNCCDAFYLARGLFSPPDMRRVAQDRGLMRDLLGTLNGRAQAVVDAATSDGVKAFCVIGPEYVFGVLGDPSRYSDLVAPYDTLLHDRIRRAGALSMVHMHGPISALLPEIADTRPDALDPLEGPPGGDLDLATAKRTVGDRLCLVGNLHDFAVLHDAKPRSLRSIALSCLSDAAEGGRYILSGAHTGIYGEAAVANWLRIARLVRKHGAYL